jgi:hypothetical protein
VFASLLKLKQTLAFTFDFIGRDAQSLAHNSCTVIPACPESFPPQRNDSGQAGMTVGFYDSIVYIPYFHI